MFEVRKVLPLAGHKCVTTRTCYRTYCECGWSSCAHWERREAYGEWHPAGWHLRADRRVRYRLSLAGVLSDYLTPWQRLTPLGIAVKAYLAATPGDHP